MSTFDNHTPVVILFGPRACGKTMTLVRLCRYLLQEGYSVQPCRTFRGDNFYVERLNTFKESIFSDYAQQATRRYEDILVEVIDKKGRLRCYIFDTSGDDLMDQDNLQLFVLQLFTSPNPKRWCYFIEPYYADVQARVQYVHIIEQVHRHFVNSREDKEIINFNKVDQTNFMLSNELIDGKMASQLAHNLYPSLFDIFKNKSFMRWLNPYNVKFVPFITGYFCDNNDVCRKYIIGSDIFPAKLWNAFGV